MKENHIEIEFVVERDDMSDEEFEEQESRIFIITKEDLINLTENGADLSSKETVCRNNFYFKIKP